MSEKQHVGVGICEDHVFLTIDDVHVHIPWREAMNIGGVLVACAIEVADGEGIPEAGIQAAMDQAGAMVESLVTDD